LQALGAERSPRVSSVSAAQALLSFIAPPRCPVCQALDDWRRPLCSSCRSRLLAQPVPPELRGYHPAPGTTYSAAPHEGIARELVRALKFRAALPLAGIMAERIAATVPAHVWVGELVPVPPAPRRFFKRGFDPAAEIANGLAELTGLPVAECLARRDGPRQVGRSRRERLSDPPEILVARPAVSSVVLVDDVCTTGATLAACAGALRRGGCRRVLAVTFVQALGESGLRA
jgi:predicted amidophosphoribosyltransferase